MQVSLNFAKFKKNVRLFIISYNDVIGNYERISSITDF